jgi:hypothetical protein
MVRKGLQQNDAEKGKHSSGRGKEDGMGTIQQLTWIRVARRYDLKGHNW